MKMRQLIQKYNQSIRNSYRDYCFKNFYAKGHVVHIYYYLVTNQPQMILITSPLIVKLYKVAVETKKASPQE